MERVLQVLNRMEADGVIDDYAIGGGIASIYYLEPYQTDDIDVFIPAIAVAVGQAGLISSEPIYGYLKTLGYVPVREGVLIEDCWSGFSRPLNPYRRRRSYIRAT